MSITLPAPLTGGTFARARDAARELGEFTSDEFAERLGWGNNGRTRNVLAKLADVGIIAAPGKAHRAKGAAGRRATYRYLKPVAVQETARERRRPPEVEAREQFKDLTPARGRPVEAARKRRKLRKEVAELLALADTAGWPTKRQKHGTLIMRPDGFPVTAIPHTPSDHHSLANCLADLVRAGMPGLERAA